MGITTLSAREEPRIDYKHVAKHLLHHGYATFMLPQIIPYIGPIFEEYKRFLATPPEFRKKWTIHLPVSKKADHGYSPPKGEGFDPKHIFQYRTDLKRMLLELQPGELDVREQLLTLKEFEEYEDWLHNLGEVSRIMRKVMLEIAKELDRQLPGYDLFGQLKRPELIPRNLIRLIEYEYDPARKGEPLASLHTDQSAVTGQWYESEDGLVIIDCNGNEIRYDYVLGLVTVFFGKKISSATNGLLLPTKHYVDSIAKTNRNSGIYFMHTDHPSVELK